MASGDTLLVFTAQAAQFPASNFATPDTRNNHPVLDYDDTTDETAYFGGVLPRNYDGGGLTVTVSWMATTATAGTVTWNSAVEREDTGTDLDADSFAAASVASAPCSATCGAPVYTAMTFADGAAMDSLAAGEAFRLSVVRDADHATDDTMVGDAEVLTVEIKET